MDSIGDKYIAASKVAALLGRHLSTVHRWCTGGKVQYIRVGKGGGTSPSYMIERASLREFLGAAAEAVGL